MPVILAIIAAAAGALLLRRRSRPKPLGRSVIVSARDSTVVARDGAVRSVQSARLTLPRSEMERLWAPPSLENLGTTYWRFLSRATLHLVRVIYSGDSRSVVLLIKPLRLLRFELPEYELGQHGGKITWRIRDGLLVAPPRRGHGWLALEVQDVSESGDSAQATLAINVEVANFYPSIAAGFGTVIYEATQSFVHVLVTHGFLRSLASLRLAQTKVGKLGG